MSNDERVFSGNCLIRYMETENEKFSADMDIIDKMIYHTPCGSGDQHFVDVCYKDGEVHRIFDPLCVVWGDNDDRS